MSIQSIKETSGHELDRILAAAHAAFLEWRTAPFATRAQRMREAARVREFVNIKSVWIA